MSAPWFKIYSKELLSDPKIKLLDHDHIGKLVLLWAFANEDRCCIPSDPEAIGKLLGITNKNQMVKHLVWIHRFFVPVEGDEARLISLRLLEEQTAYEAKCDQLRANGLKGGRPRKPEAKPDGLPDGKPKPEPDETEVGSGKKEKEVPPNPQGGIGEPKRKRRTRTEIVQGFPEDVKTVVNTLGSQWRAEDPVDGRKITLDVASFAQRVSEILGQHPEITPQTLIGAGEAYLASQRTRYKAPQFFFGPGVGGEGPPWLGFVRAVITRNALPLEPVQ